MARNKKYDLYITDSISGIELLLATFYNEGLMNLFYMRFIDLYPTMHLKKTA